MNIFRSESAPFAVVVMVGALGWYVSTLQETLGDRLSLVYTFEKRSYGIVALRLDNISREEIFQGKFNISCAVKEGSKPCLTQGKQARYGVVEPYNLSNEIELKVNDKNEIVQVTAWIPPAATIIIELPSSHRKSQFNFQYLPVKDDGTNPMPKFYRGGLKSLIIGKFDDLLIGMFALSLVGLILVLILQFLKSLCSGRKPKDVDQKLHDITVRHHFADTLSGSNINPASGSGS